MTCHPHCMRQPASDTLFNIIEGFCVTMDIKVCVSKNEFPRKVVMVGSLPLPLWSLCEDGRPILTQDMQLSHKPPIVLLKHA